MKINPSFLYEIRTRNPQAPVVLLASKKTLRTWSGVKGQRLLRSLLVVHASASARVPSMELISRFSKIQDLLRYTEKNYSKIPLIVSPEFGEKRFEGASAETRRKQSIGVRGPRNARFGKPLGPEYRKKISDSIKRNGSKKGINNPIFGTKRSSETREKISRTLRKKRRAQPLRWCHDPSGKEFRIPDGTLPPGCVWGRARGSTRAGPLILPD
jgi:hypothetical protein